MKSDYKNFFQTCSWSFGPNNQYSFASKQAHHWHSPKNTNNALQNIQLPNAQFPITTMHNIGHIYIYNMSSVDHLTFFFLRWYELLLLYADFRCTVAWYTLPYIAFAEYSINTEYRVRVQMTTVRHEYYSNKCSR